MIKIVLVTDENNIIGHSNLGDYFERASQWSKDKVAEIDKIFAGDNMVVGRTTLPLCSSYIPKYDDFYVLTQSPDKYSETNCDVTFTSDYMKLVEKYQDSKNTLIVGGGKATWEIFLPYAKEFIICLTYDESMGDIVFDDWTKLNTVLTKEEEWNGGKTQYYQVD
ncbi:MAG: dihydrofolate reductase [Firmicutes bacterium]|nr:dihydrofolate reductase [Bacillota bacterium]